MVILADCRCKGDPETVFKTAATLCCCHDVVHQNFCPSFKASVEMQRKSDLRQARAISNTPIGPFQIMVFALTSKSKEFFTQNLLDCFPVQALALWTAVQAHEAFWDTFCLMQTVPLSHFLKMFKEF